MPQPDTRFLPSDFDTIRFKVRRIIGRYGLVPSDEADLHQDLAAHVITRIGLHDVARAGRRTFVSRVIDCRIANLIRELRAQKRGRCCEKPPALSDIPEELIRRRHTNQALNLDLIGALASLPTVHLDIALSLMDRKPAEVARLFGLTRGQMRSAMARIRNHLSALRIPETRKENDDRP